MGKSWRHRDITKTEVLYTILEEKIVYEKPSSN
jgi:hypothetical protein